MFRFKNEHLVRYAVVVCLVLSVSFVTPSLREPVVTILKYPLAVFSLIRREILGIIFFHRNMVLGENFSRQLDSLKRQLNNSQELHLENSRLKDLLSLKQKSSFKVIAAQVIGRSSDNWASLVIINRGRHHGVRKGYVVINYLGLVGKIIEAFDSTSKVMLINDPHIGVSSMVSRSRQEGLVSGTLGNSLIMRYLPNDSDVQVSDVVITSGLTQGYPKGLLIGTVAGMGDEFSGLSRYAIIKPVVNLGNIEEVLIIIP